jgi:uncharacterized small protein (DUF1192 family)
MPVAAPFLSAPASVSESNEDRGSAEVHNEIAALREEISTLKAQLNQHTPASRKKRQKRIAREG